MNRTRIALNKHLLGSLFMCMLAALLLLPAAGGAHAVAPVQLCGQWSIVASPSKGTLDDLYGIAAISPRDVWAVGRYVAAHNQTLIEHWNGTSWSIVKSPSPDSAGDILLGVAAVSPTNVWAVGSTSSSTLIEHWDGTSWSVIPSPGAGGALFGISILSSTDIWAAGALAGQQGHAQTLIEQWNGSQWSIIKSPNPSAFNNGFNSITALSSTNIWAVGSSYRTQFGDQQALIEHWNGSQWSLVTSPSLGSYPYELRAVSAVSANDIWAVGDYTTAPGDILLTLAEHWNGKTWSVVPTPSPTGDDYLLGVVALSTRNVWAVGDYSSAGQNLVEQWDGLSWHVVPSPYRSGRVSGLSAVSADSAFDVWAAGSDISTKNFTYHTLIEHYC